MTTVRPQLHYYDFGAPVLAFSTTRHGGVGVGQYASFNVNSYCGDDPSHIEANRQGLCEQLGIGRRQLVFPHQTHQTELRAIDADFLLQPAHRQHELLEGVDGVMTAERGICVGVSTADCIPVLLYDAAHGAVAAVHAGWRGTVGRIVARAVETMAGTYATRPENLRAVIGPGISLEHFEVGDEVYGAFAAAGHDMAAIARRFPCRTDNGTWRQGEKGCKQGEESYKQGEKWHIDLWECNRLQLLGCGVRADSISVAGICTYASADDFFSARRLGISSGRILTAIMLK